MAKAALKQEIRNVILEEIEALAQEDENIVEDEVIEDASDDDEETVEENSQLGGGSQNDTGAKLAGQIKSTVSAAKTKMEKGKDVAGDESDNQDAPSRMKRGKGKPSGITDSRSAKGEDKNQKFMDTLKKAGPNDTASSATVKEDAETDDEVVTETEAEVLEPIVTKDDLNVEQDMEAIFGGQELSPEFIEKAKSIFEAAVLAKVNETLHEVIEVMQEEYEAREEQLYEEMTTKVDEYLNLVVENWLTENKVEVEKSINVQIAESFMEGLRELFMEHNIAVPEGREDLVEDLIRENSELEDKLNQVLESLVEQNKELESEKRKEVLAQVSEGLSESQVKKLGMLAEAIAFEDEDQFAEKLAEIRESYFAKKPVVVKSVEADDTPVVIEEDKVISDPAVRLTTDVISRYFGKNR